MYIAPPFKPIFFYSTESVNSKFLIYKTWRAVPSHITQSTLDIFNFVNLKVFP